MQDVYVNDSSRKLTGYGGYKLCWFLVEEEKHSLKINFSGLFLFKGFFYFYRLRNNANVCASSNVCLVLYKNTTDNPGQHMLPTPYRDFNKKNSITRTN